MADKVKATLSGGTIVEGTDVALRESSEKWSEVTLEDGTVIRVKAIVLSATKLDGQFDNQGNPVYAVRTTVLSVVHSSPEHLRKKQS